MMKRAQGLSIETIIVAVLLFALLIVFLFLIARHSVIFTKNIYDCEAQGAECVSSTAECLKMGGQPLNLDCPKSRPVCCKRPAALKSSDKQG